MKKSLYYLYIFYDLSILLGLFFGRYPFNSFVILFGLGLVFILVPLSFYKYILPKAWLFLLIFMLIWVNGTLTYKYYLNEDYYAPREVFALTDGTDVPVKAEKIQDKFSLFIPESFTKDDLMFTSKDKSVLIEVLFTKEDLLQTEIENYVSSNAYFLEETGYKNVAYTDENPSVLSYTNDHKYVLEYYASIEDKLVKVVFSCPEKEAKNYKTLFDLIILTIYYT